MHVQDRAAATKAVVAAAKVHVAHAADGQRASAHDARLNAHVQLAPAATDPRVTDTRFSRGKQMCLLPATAFAASSCRHSIAGCATQRCRLKQRNAT